jgi:hypothetical protein
MSRIGSKKVLYQLLGEKYVPDIVAQREQEQYRPDSSCPKPLLNDIQTHVVEFGLGSEKIAIESLCVLHNPPRHSYLEEEPYVLLARSAANVYQIFLVAKAGQPIGVSSSYSSQITLLYQSETNQILSICPLKDGQSILIWEYSPQEERYVLLIYQLQQKGFKRLLKVKKTPGFDCTLFVSQTKRTIGVSISRSTIMLVSIGTDNDWHSNLCSLNFLVELDPNFLGQPIYRLCLSETDHNGTEACFLSIFFESTSVLVYKVDPATRTAAVFKTVQADSMDIERLDDGPRPVAGRELKVVHCCSVPEYQLMVRCVEDAERIRIEKARFDRGEATGRELVFEMQAVITREEGCEYRFSELKLDLFQKILLVVYKASAEGVCKAIVSIDSRPVGVNPHFSLPSVTELEWTPYFPKNTGVRLQTKIKSQTSFDSSFSGLKGTNFIMLSNANQALVQKI